MVDPTLAGSERLSQRLAAAPAPLTAVVEPTSMTWLALALAVERALTRVTESLRGWGELIPCRREKKGPVALLG